LVIPDAKSEKILKWEEINAIDEKEGFLGLRKKIDFKKRSHKQSVSK